MSLIIGTLFILLGILVKKYPMLISGYNTLSKEDRKLVDIEGLSSWTKKCFLTMGVLFYINYTVFRFTSFSRFEDIIAIAIIFIGVSIMIARGQSFNQNKTSSNKAALVGVILTGILVTGLVAYTYLPNKAIVSNESIEFSGIYGTSIPFSNIQSIEILDSIPPIKVRTNGSSIGNLHKGLFRLEKWGKCRLLIQSEHPPYLVITPKSGRKIIFNSNSTLEVFQTIEADRPKN